MKRNLKWIIFLALCAAAAFGALQLSNKHDQPTWRTAKIKRGDISVVINASGALMPSDLLTVGTQVSGKVSQIYVKTNDHVHKGQLLAEIDPTLLVAQLKQSQSAMENARLTYEQAHRDLKRSRMLLEKDYIAQIDLEHAEQAYLFAKNSFESAKTQVGRDTANLDYTKIVSPIDGLVIAQLVTLGQTVTASFETPHLFTVAGDMTKMKINLNISESDIPKIKTGMAVTFNVDAFPNREFQGNVDEINLSSNNMQGVVTYTVVVTVDNSDALLLPGMTAAASIVVADKKDVLRVPLAAMRFKPPKNETAGLNNLLQIGTAASEDQSNQSQIYILRDGKAVTVPVAFGISDDSFMEIAGGSVAEGDQAIIGMTSAGAR